MSLCGPEAVAHVTRQDVREVVAFIEWRRERNGKRPTLRGGTYDREIWAALDHAGYDFVRVFKRRRIRLADLAREGFTGAWLFHQRDHFFSVRSGAELRRLAAETPHAIVVGGWRVTRRK